MHGRLQRRPPLPEPLWIIAHEYEWTGRVLIPAYACQDNGRSSQGVRKYSPYSVKSLDHSSSKAIDATVRPSGDGRTRIAVKAQAKGRLKQSEGVGVPNRPPQGVPLRCADYYERKTILASGSRNTFGPSL